MEGAETGQQAQVENEERKELWHAERVKADRASGIRKRISYRSGDRGLHQLGDLLLYHGAPLLKAQARPTIRSTSGGNALG
jgi:hypothetical protein